MRSSFEKNRGRPSLPLWQRVGFKPLAALLLLGVLLFCALPSSVATNPPTWEPAATQPADIRMLDMELSLRAQKALAQDPELSNQEIGISVRNRDATLWGTVSTSTMSQQAVKRVREVFGLGAIRNDLHIEFADNPNAERLPPLQARSPLAEPMPREMPPPRQSVARRPGEPMVALSQEVLWHAATPRAVLKSVTDDLQAPARGPSPKASGEKTPMPLVSLPGYPARQLPISPRPPSTGPREQDGADLSKTVESLRLSDTRYYRVQAEVHGGVVSLRGTVFRWEHLYDLARSVASLKGVERVILEDVHADSD